MMQKRFHGIVTLIAILAPTTFCRADVIASNRAGTLNLSVSLFVGQEFVTPAGPAEDNLVFNFYSDTSATTPAAFGTGFLLSSAYAGLPGGLSSSTSGFLGQAAASGGVFTFAPSITLQP